MDVAARDLSPFVSENMFSEAPETFFHEFWAHALAAATNPA
jgi:hypothetical protein